MEDSFGDRITDGVVIAKHGDAGELTKLRLFHGGHPVPDQKGCEGCKQMLQMIQKAHLTQRDLVFTVIGNGVSSLLTLPPEELSLEDVMEITRILQVEKGISTREVNYVRNQVDVLKGGRITRLLYPAKMVHLITIDINEPETDGSFGYDQLMNANFWLHTMPDMTTPEMAIEILKESGAWEAIDPSIRQYLMEGKGPRTLKKEEFEQMDCHIYGVMPNELGTVPSATRVAAELGYKPHLLSRRTFVEAAELGTFMGRMAKLIEEENEPFAPPCALIVGGEMLVTVGKNGGVGGRNQEFALSCAQVVAGSEKITIGAVDTDGTDGPGGLFNEQATQMGCTNLAGAIVDGFTAKEIRDEGINLTTIIKKHATSDALWRVGSGVWAEASISLQDLIVVLIDK